MLVINMNQVTYWPTLEAAAKIAERNMIDDPETTYVCESRNDGKTWAVAIWDNGLHLGYL